MSLRSSIAAVVALLACWWPSLPDSARVDVLSTAKSRTLIPGVWGGDHIRMVVGRDDARLEYDCATGTIDQPIILDASGKFIAKGSHTPEHGGPRRNQQAAVPRARYVGRVIGDTMTLTVTLEAGGQRVGVFRLKRGNDPLLTKCR